MNNFLKRLELQGFKSFAVKTTLEFPARVTAVVGPNGSGKSNIIDGLRWVLGERGARELRGETLGNLIFAGTPKRSAAGLAKVVLYFDNRSHELSEERAEVMLARKIDRAGNSQFFLNDSEIRLKDLIPLLARAKLGTRGLTMIGQGQSDLFVRSEPKERRLMIEEILGLREFRLKKDQAERRLESSRINMDKVDAMLQELSPHLRFLRKQKNRFDKRSEIESSLRELENDYFSFHCGEIIKRINEIEPRINKLSIEKKEKEKEIQAAERNLKEIESRVFDAEETNAIKEDLSRLLERRFETEKNLARLEAKMEFQSKTVSAESHSNQELIGTLSSFAEEIKNLIHLDDLERIRQNLKDWLSKINKFLGQEKKSAVDIFVADKEKLKDELTDIEKETKALRKKEEEIAEEQRKVNWDFRSRLELLEKKKNEFRELEQKIQTNLFEKEKLGLRLDELTHRWLAVGRLESELKKLGKKSNETVGKTEINWDEAERKMMRLQAELTAIGEIDEALVKEAEESEVRYEYLNKELKDLEKASVDLKALIKELEQKIHLNFEKAFRSINEEFNKYFRLMFGGGKARLKILKPIKQEKILPDEKKTENQSEKNNEPVEESKEPVLLGVDIELNLPRKKIGSLEILSGGEKSLVSLAALFALIAVSPPPFLVLDEIDAALDDENARRFAELIKEFSKKTQFIIVTHNRATMEAADVLYGITLGEDGTSKVLSLKLEAST